MAATKTTTAIGYVQISTRIDAGQRVRGGGSTSSLTAVRSQMDASSSLEPVGRLRRGGATIGAVMSGLPAASCLAAPLPALLATTKAGDSVLIAPVSTRFPCYQGI
jgi:hypothetical protein